MVALELNDLSEVLVLDECAIARELLPEELEELLRVELVGDALDRCERLAPVALLDPDVHVFGRLCTLLELLLVGDLVRIREGVYRSRHGRTGFSLARSIKLRPEPATLAALTKGSQVLHLAGRGREFGLLGLLLLGLGGRALLLLFLGYLVGREGCAGACVVMTTE